MAVLTPQQTTAIDTKLSVSLPTLSDDKIIELCLLQRAAPEVKPEFVEALNDEITRRFTAAEIAANDVMFSVIQNFANQFTSGVPLFAKKMLEMSANVNRDIWFSNNSSMFAQAIEDETLLEWLVTQPDVVTKILNNTLGLTAIAKSTKASTAILSNAESVVIFKDATNVWQIVTGQSQFMGVLVLSNELMTYVVNNSTALNAVVASSVAMATVAASSIAMTAVIASSTAMSEVVASSVAMASIAVSSTALTKIVVSTVARNALMNNNSVFQGVRQRVYDTIKTSWVKKAGVSQQTNPNQPLTNINNAVSAPQGFVFASLGWTNTYTAGTVEAKHPNGVIANTAGTSSTPTTLAKLDAISFDGATLKGGAGNYPTGYAELWSPT